MLEEHLNKFVITYLNNIIIYLDTEKKHKKHIKWVLEILSKKTYLLQLKNVSFILKRLIL